MSFTLDQTASIWGAIATLLAVAFAWFAHVAASLESRKRLYRGVSNLLMGIQKEMELIGHWAGDDEKGVGYLRATSKAEYFVEKLTNWGHPSRTIFHFDYPAIKNLTASEQVGFLAPIIDEFVKFNYSIGRLYDLYEESRQYAFSRPELFNKVAAKLESLKKGQAFSAADLTPPESEYFQTIFSYNYKLHVDLIGGKDSKDSICLFKTFNKAKYALRKFARNLEKEPLPWLYRIGHALAGIIFLGAVILILEWFGLVHIITPVPLETPQTFPFY